MPKITEKFSTKDEGSNSSQDYLRYVCMITARIEPDNKNYKKARLQSRRMAIPDIKSIIFIHHFKIQQANKISHMFCNACLESYSSAVSVYEIRQNLQLPNHLSAIPES